MWFKKDIALNRTEGKMMFVYIDHNDVLWYDPPFIELEGFQLRRYFDTDGKEIKEDFADFGKA